MNKPVSPPPRKTPNKQKTHTHKPKPTKKTNPKRSACSNNYFIMLVRNAKKNANCVRITSHVYTDEHISQVFCLTTLLTS